MKIKNETEYKIKDYSYLDVFTEKLKREKITECQKSDYKRFKLRHYEYTHVLIARGIYENAIAKNGFHKSLISLTQEEERLSFASFWIAMEIALNKYQRANNKEALGNISQDEAEIYWTLATTYYKEHDLQEDKRKAENLEWASKALSKIDKSYKPKKLVSWINLEGNYAMFESGAWEK